MSNFRFPLLVGVDDANGVGAIVRTLNVSARDTQRVA